MFNEWYRPNCTLEFPIGGSQAMVSALVRWDGNGLVVGWWLMFCWLRGTAWSGLLRCSGVQAGQGRGPHGTQRIH